jgi:hypothetical protein
VRVSLTLALVSAIWLGTLLGDSALKRMTIQSLRPLFEYFGVRGHHSAVTNAVVNRKIRNLFRGAVDIIEFDDQPSDDAMPGHRRRSAMCGSAVTRLMATGDPTRVTAAGLRLGFR